MYMYLNILFVMRSEKRHTLDMIIGKNKYPDTCTCSLLQVPSLQITVFRFMDSHTYMNDLF